MTRPTSISIDAAADFSAFDDVIDVRSPSEFAEDHIPGAVNLPVLDDAERAQVGAIYVRQDRFLARKVGAGLAAAAIARHLQGFLAEKPGDYAPLVYCWRGGQRSGSMALVLDQIGWRVRILQGGYKAYRRRVSERLYLDAPWFTVIALEGPTCVGKTELLARLRRRGLATLDLEALAAHRGSIFGGDATQAQPSQKMFETLLLQEIDRALAAARPGSPLIVEAESSKIGARLVPPALWKAMLRAPALTVSAPLEARAAYCVSRYADIVADPARLDALLGKLNPLTARDELRAWRKLAAEGAYEALAAALMRRHYDPTYARSTEGRARARLGAATLTDLSDGALDAAAAQLDAMIRRWDGRRPERTGGGATELPASARP